MDNSVCVYTCVCVGLLCVCVCVFVCDSFLCVCPASCCPSPSSWPWLLLTILEAINHCVRECELVCVWVCVLVWSSASKDESSSTQQSQVRVTAVCVCVCENPDSATVSKVVDGPLDIMVLTVCLLHTFLTQWCKCFTQQNTLQSQNHKCVKPAHTQTNKHNYT